ncbi:MAG: hypothetical protein HWN67_15720 [Candidatus Helarchaeota archaeon]|nr:hypothetical protein [Candidatus Helarchaeota archaeon]
MSSVEVIKAIFIFDKKSGRPFIRFRPSRDFQIEPFLVIGFLTAIMKFSKEVGRSDLKMIDMENLRFVFTEKDGIIFNAITTKLVKPIDLMFKLNTISTIFLNEYTMEELLDPKIALEYYDGFKNTIDEIIHGTVRGLELERESKLKEILNEFNKNNELDGSGIISFTGDFLVTAFNKIEDEETVHSIFNSIFETKIFGINNFTITILNRHIIITRIEEESLLVIIMREDQICPTIEENIEEIKKRIRKILRG